MTKTTGRTAGPRRVWKQGGLDGLCGLYSAVNALQVLRGAALAEEPAIAVFESLAAAVPDKFPAALCDGFGVPEMRVILDFADSWARRHWGFGVARSEPMLRSAPKRVDAYAERLRELLDGPRRVLIVGLKEPWEHWTVLTDVTARTLRFRDSLTIKIARRGDVSLGEGATYRFDPHQVFLLRRVAI